MARQKNSLSYNKKLKEKFKYVPGIKRIDRHRQLPASIYKARKAREIIEASQRRKQDNVKKYTKPEKMKKSHERSKHIVTQLE